MDDGLTQRAHDVASSHARLLAEALGDQQVRAVWLTGSAVLGDLTASSDIDTVTLLDGPPDAVDEDCLVSVHAALAAQHPDVRYDTTYLEAAALANPPDPGVVLPQSIDGRLILDRPAGEVHAVTWFTLPRAIRVAGLRPVDVEIAADREAALAHSRANLHAYWVGSVAGGLRAALAGRGTGEVLEHPDTVVWTVLGAPRLAMFLDPTASYAGPVPSKTEAGCWVARTRPEYADLSGRALASRHGRPARFTVADALAAADLVESLP